MRGTYTNIVDDGNIIYKKISPISIHEKEILNMLYSETSLKNKLKKYVNDLKEIGISIPKIYKIDDTSINMEKVEGKTIDEIINQGVTLDEVLKMFEKVIKVMKMEIESDKEIIIDYNLKNFIYNDNKIVLVDIVPPLYREDVKKIEKSRYKLISDIYLNYEIKISGVIGYFIKAKINDDKYNFNNDELIKSIKYLLDGMIKKLNENDIEYDICKIINEYGDSHVFVTRIKLLYNFCNNNYKKNNFRDVYNNLSLNKLMQDKNQNQYSYKFCMQDVNVNVKSNNEIIIKKLVDVYDKYLSDKEEIMKYKIKYNYSIDFYIDQKIYNNMIIKKGIIKDCETDDDTKNLIVINQDKRNIQVYMKEINPRKLLFAKRILSNVICKIFEEAGYMMFHGACVSNDKESVIITGDKGAGKTTTMLMYLENGYKFISNDMVAVKIVDGKLIACGFPISVGIILNEDLKNPKIREYLQTSKSNEKDGNKIYIKTNKFVELLNTEIIRNVDVSKVIILKYKEKQKELEITEEKIEEFIKFAKSQILPSVHQGKKYLDDAVVIKKVTYNIKEMFEKSEIQRITQGNKTREQFEKEVMKI